MDKCLKVPVIEAWKCCLNEPVPDWLKETDIRLEKSFNENWTSFYMYLGSEYEERAYIGDWIIKNMDGDIYIYGSKEGIMEWATLEVNPD